MNEVNDKNIDGYKNLFDNLNSKLCKKITEEEFNKIKNLIIKLLNFQKITLDDIEYYESGQSYTALGIGDIVLKIGPEVKCVKNPYQLLPFHQESLEDSKQKMYLCHRAKNKNLSQKDAQRLYNLIRDMGGLWVDPKENNLGTITNFSNISNFFENNIDYYDTEIQFSTNNGNIYIIDFEDVIFLTQEIIQSMDKSNRWSVLPYGGNESKRIYTDYLKSNSIDEIYEQNYIYPSETLLIYEQQYQKEKENIEKVQICKNRLKEIEKRRKQARKEMVHNSENKYSARQIGKQILQKTNLTRIKGIISTMKEKFQNKQNLSNNSKNDYTLKKNYDNTDPWRTL